MSNSGNIWKERFIWIAGCALFAITVSISIVLVSKDEKVTSYFSAIATGSSVVLAIVAIVYSSLERMASRQQVGEMEVLIRQASGIIGEKAQIFVGQSEVLEKITESLLTQQPTEQLEQKEQGPIDEPSQPTYPLKISLMSPFILNVLYLLMKIHETKRDIPIVKAIKLCMGEPRQTDDGDFGIDAGLFYGVLEGLKAAEGVKVKITDETRCLFVEGLPPTINEEISKEVVRRFKDGGIWASVRSIDEYFEAA